jgi:hypothetical protein
MYNTGGLVTDGLFGTPEPAKPSLAWWDASRRGWFTDGFADVSLDRQTNLLRFSTKRLAPVAVIQKRSRFVVGG